MKKIYIIQMHTKTIPARFIKFFTRYNYTHIAISFSKSCKKIYSFGRKKPNSFIEAGFVEVHKNGKFFEKFNDTKCRIYELNVTNEQYNRLKKKILFMKDNNELFKYDFLGIILRFFRLPISFKNKYVCSYFVADLLAYADIYKFNKKLYFIEPRDFENIDKLHEIYQGKFLLHK